MWEKSYKIDFDVLKRTCFSGTRWKAAGNEARWL